MVLQMTRIIELGKNLNFGIKKAIIFIIDKKVEKKRRRRAKCTDR